MPDRPNTRLKVMVSSTIIDLPEHRQHTLDACLRQGMFPLMMEHPPTYYSDPISFSLGLVDDADIYIGIYANRYGHVPSGAKNSITEMEYNRAVERGIPRLIFVMHKEHAIKIEDVDIGEGASKLKAFKDRIGSREIIDFFKSPADLRAHVINRLSHHRQPELGRFHYVSEIIAPPEPYIAHPYTLLQSRGLIGRDAELNLLTDWVSQPETEIYSAHILNIVAIGGMGKSALIWKWFNEIAPQEIKPLSGSMWWSFYESDATFENFVMRALVYVGHRPWHEVEKMQPLERELELRAALDQKPFLIVLDGLERILIAYAHMDASRLSDDDLDEKSANIVARSMDLPATASESFIGRHSLRKTADPRAGAFLRKLCSVRASRILISTRLYPADLQLDNGEPRYGSFAYFLRGLNDHDAMSLWREFKVTGRREDLTSLFHTFENHPLLIQSLAAEVANFRKAPADFEKWRNAHPKFDPFNLPLIQVKSHVLLFALQGLGDSARKLLHIIAAFRMPATYDTLVALTVGTGKKFRVFRVEDALDVSLTELQDRGLIGWDRRANRYDLHPVVRGVAWASIGAPAKQDLYTDLHVHFQSVPYKKNWQDISSFDELTATVELYNTLVGLARYDDAYLVFRDRFARAANYRLNAGYQRAMLLEMLFPDGIESEPRLTHLPKKAWTLDALAMSYQLSGQPGRAVQLYRRSNAISEALNDWTNLAIGLSNLSTTLLLSAALREAELAARKAFSLSSERGYKNVKSDSLWLIGRLLATRGVLAEAQQLLNWSLQLSIQTGSYSPYSYLAVCALFAGDYGGAASFAQKATEYCERIQYKRGLIRATRLSGMAALRLGKLAEADECLHRALTQAREVRLVEEELPALTGLAEFRQQQGNVKAARELLDDVWEAAERGPYPLFHADALNIFARIENRAGNHNAAVSASVKAYSLAWCDGPPFSYHIGLEMAKQNLAELGAREPKLPWFVESKFEPMPQIGINPPRE
ncbi:MAG TPA: DUF4062 domain-containing protein [Candidatus Angelobacter sp.]|jgi:hypothetical protein|nr:DUF4062 domain-containing protein [Candidatus Angelobacter sp.]